MQTKQASNITRLAIPDFVNDYNWIWLDWIGFNWLADCSVRFD